MRLIDADALTKRICDDTSLHYRDTRMLLRYIAQAKTISEDIVMCKDCIRNGEWEVNCPFAQANFHHGDDDFCSCAERREP